jgi:hypothetical protein
MDLDGNNAYKISSDGQCPIWSPKGNLIAFVCNGWIYVMKPDGSERRRVCEGKIIDWLPDGKRLLASMPNWKGFSGGVHIIDINGNIVKHCFELAGRWSSDGKLLLCGLSSIYNAEGKKIPLKEPFPKVERNWARGKHWQYKKPDNIW